MLESMKVSNRYDASNPQIGVWDRIKLEQEAKMAIEFVARWGSVAAEIDGEDSAGRQKFRLQTPDELVARACDVAHKLFKEFRIMGWVHITPSILKEAENEPTENRAKNTDAG